MTNTRATDPEVLEKRIPVLIRQFGLRAGSGGKGWHRGGDGAIRIFEPRCNMIFTVNAERRANRPYGMAGGEPARPGLNLALLNHPSGKQRLVNVGGKVMLHLRRGEQLQMYSPGGGGWGAERPQNDGQPEADDVNIVNGVNGDTANRRTEYARGSGSLHQYAIIQAES